MDSTITRVLSDDARALRTAIFMDEQGFEHEFDDYDEPDRAIHLVLHDEIEPIATGRLYPSSGEKDVWLLGRIAIVAERRGTGLGRVLITELERIAALEGAVRVELSAQVRASGFYERCGYRQVGEPYDDEGCPHIKMVKSLA